MRVYVLDGECGFEVWCVYEDGCWALDCILSDKSQALRYAHWLRNTRCLAE